jgi:RNA polymerase-binding transcription factor DksA
MTDAEIQFYRQRLLAFTKRLGSDVSALKTEALQPLGGETSGGLSNLPVHLADMGTDNFEEEVTLTLLENAGHILTEINDALDRIEKGTFGRCEECGKEIPRERLNAVPYARYCVQDAQKLQEQGGK